jgi:hypothetical protein
LSLRLGGAVAPGPRLVAQCDYACGLGMSGASVHCEIYNNNADKQYKAGQGRWPIFDRALPVDARLNAATRVSAPSRPPSQLLPRSGHVHCGLLLTA